MVFFEHDGLPKPDKEGIYCPAVHISGKCCGINPLKPNDLKKRRTTQLTSRCCILYIYSTNIRTEYFKHAA